MRSEDIVALTQAGGPSLAAGFRLLGLVVLGFLLLEILYLVCCTLFLSRDRDDPRQKLVSRRP